MSTRPRSLLSGTCIRSSPPRGADDGAGAGSGVEPAAGGCSRPTVRHTSSSSSCLISPTASSASGPPSASSVGLLRPDPVEGPRGDALQTMSSWSWPTSPSCASAARRTWPIDSMLTCLRVGSAIHGSFGYMPSSSACVALFSRDFSRALALPFMRSWPSMKPCMSIRGCRSSQCRYSSPALQESALEAKCTNASDTSAPARSSTEVDRSFW
mmetsp:Transcript_99937/g.260541  ORF Transcript_99937/g.260541 Transcript_99937/m.260541 type:complete len:212 (+) Transcript_99937:625-1260(+)